MGIRVRWQTEPGEVVERDFDSHEIVLGRSPLADLRLEREHASPLHCRVVRRAGKIIVVDLKGTSGTWLNDRRVSSPQIVKPHDIVWVDGLGLYLEASPGRPGPWPLPRSLEDLARAGEAVVLCHRRGRELLLASPDGAWRRRVLLETRTLPELDAAAANVNAHLDFAHPALVPLVDAEHDDGVWTLDLDAPAGVDLDWLVYHLEEEADGDRRARFPREVAAQIVAQVRAALAAIAPLLGELLAFRLDPREIHLGADGVVRLGVPHLELRDHFHRGVPREPFDPEAACRRLYEELTGARAWPVPLPGTEPEALAAFLESVAGEVLARRRELEDELALLS